MRAVEPEFVPTVIFHWSSSGEVVLARVVVFHLLFSLLSQKGNRYSPILMSEQWQGYTLRQENVTPRIC